MNEIISLLQNTLKLDSNLHFIKNYPIKIIHTKERVKEKEKQHYFDSINFFDQNGFSAHTYDNDSIKLIQNNAKDYIQNISFGISKKQDYETFTFSEKFPHDRWKKVVNDDDLEAVVEISHLSNQELPLIETQLRDIMRRTKEVPLLKKRTFIWVAYVDTKQDISEIMQHYFLENYTTVKTDKNTIFIGWNEQLQNINMRYFVYPPQ